MYPEFILSLALGIGIFIGLFGRLIARLVWGIFFTSYSARTLKEAEDIGDAAAGDTRIMTFEVTRRGRRG